MKIMTRQQFFALFFAFILPTKRKRREINMHLYDLTRYNMYIPEVGFRDFYISPNGRVIKVR